MRFSLRNILRLSTKKRFHFADSLWVTVVQETDGGCDCHRQQHGEQNRPHTHTQGAFRTFVWHQRHPCWPCCKKRTFCTLQLGTAACIDALVSAGPVTGPRDCWLDKNRCQRKNPHHGPGDTQAHCNLINRASEQPASLENCSAALARICILRCSNGQMVLLVSCLT